MKPRHLPKRQPQPVKAADGLIAKLRKKQRLSQSQLAARLGVHETAVSHWEIRNTLPRSTSVLVKLAAILDTSADELLAEAA